MIIVLAEAQNNVINSVLPKLLAKVSASCIRKLPSLVTPEDVEKYSTPPVMEAGWCIVYWCKNSKVVKKLCRYQNNFTILVVSSSAQKEEIAQLINSEGHEFRFINNLQITRKDKIAYVKQNLGISESEAEYLVNRTCGKVKELVSAVAALSSCKPPSRKQIQEIVPKAEKFGINDLYEYLIGYPVKRNGMSAKDAMLVLYNYRYGIGYLHEFITNRLIRDITIYDLIETDGLSLSNYREYKHTERDKDSKVLTSITEYQLYKIIEQYRCVSYEYIYFLLVCLQRMSSSDNLLLGMANLVLTRKEINNV